jgi:hypothetical protein
MALVGTTLLPAAPGPQGLEHLLSNLENRTFKTRYSFLRELWKNERVGNI